MGRLWCFHGNSKFIWCFHRAPMILSMDLAWKIQDPMALWRYSRGIPIGLMWDLVVPTEFSRLSHATSMGRTMWEPMEARESHLSPMYASRESGRSHRNPIRRGPTEAPYGTPAVVRVPCKSDGTPMGIMWACVNPIEIPWKHQGSNTDVPRTCHWSTMDAPYGRLKAPRKQHGSPMGTPKGRPMLVPWEHHGNAMENPTPYGRFIEVP